MLSTRRFGFSKVFEFELAIKKFTQQKFNYYSLLLGEKISSYSQPYPKKECYVEILFEILVQIINFAD